MKIVLDIMGGDHYPSVPMKGALDAIEQLDKDFELVLVGDERLIREHLQKAASVDQSRIQILHAPEVVEMGESPTVALRKKKEFLYLRGC